MFIKSFLSVQASNKSAANSPVKPSAPEGPARMVLALPDLFLGTGIFVLALVIRLIQLGEESLWIDEAITYGRSVLPIDKLIDDSIKRLHVPTYFVFMHYWLALGDSEYMLRLPSAVMGGLTAVASYALGVIAFGRKCGVFAALLVAIAPYQVRYGQEARMYTMYTMATTAALCGVLWLSARTKSASIPLVTLIRMSMPRRLCRASNQRKYRRILAAWSVLFFGESLALFTHNTSVYLFAVINIWAVVMWFSSYRWRWKFAENWLLSQASVLLFYSFWIPRLYQQSTAFSRGFKASFPSLEKLGLFFSNVYFLSDKTYILAILMTLGAVSGLYLLRTRRFVACVLLAFFIIPPSLNLLVSLYKPMFAARTLLWTAIPFFVLVASGLAYASRYIGFSIMGIIILLGTMELHAYYTDNTKPNWRQLIQTLCDETDTDSRIVTVWGNRYLFYYFNRRDNPLPRREYKPARKLKSSRRLKKYLKGVDKLWLFGWRRKKVFRNFHRKIKALRRYKREKRITSKYAGLIRFHLRSE